MKTIREIADEVTTNLLGKMAAGFYLDGKYRHDPLIWDVNNGYCEDWAQEVAFRFNTENDLWAQPEVAETRWYEGMDEPEHCYVVYDGRYYDAEAPDGVDDPEKLPIYGDNPRPEP